MASHLHSERRKAAAKELFLYGLSYAQIARGLGVSSATLTKVFDDPELRRARGELTKLRIRNALRRHGLEGSADD